MELPRIIVTGKFTPDDLNVSVGTSNRKTDSATEQELDVLWTETIKKAEKGGRVCYNGISYRLNSIVGNGTKLTIDFGTTEYKVRYGLLNTSKYSNLPEEFFCKSCSCSATVRTSDKLYVTVELTGRSMNTNSIDLVGGIMETDLEIHTGDDVFNSFYKELREEAGVVEDDIDEVYLQTIFLEHSSNVCFYFEVILNIKSEEILSRFINNADKDIKSIQIFNKSEYQDVLNNHQSKNKRLIAKILKI